MNEANSNTEAIARELAALGEDAPSEAELAWLRDGTLDAEPDVASVARLSELAEPFGFEELSELEIHRAWRRSEHQLSASSHAPAAAAPSPRRWLLAAAGLAAAAAVALLVIPEREQAPQLSAQDVASQGESVRVALRALDDGRSDSERARAIAAEYQRRLAEQGG